MKTKLLLSLALFAALAARAADGTKFSAVPETASLQSSNTLLVNVTETNSAGALVPRTRTITASNLLEGLQTLPNWPAAGSGTGQTNWPYTAITNEPWIENGQVAADLPALTSTNPVFSALRIFDLSSGFPQPGVLMLLPDGTLNQRTQPPGLDLGLATNLPYSGLSETAKTAITNAGAGAVSVSTIQSVMSTNGLGGVALLKASGIVSNFSILADTDDGRGAALSNAFSTATSGDCVYVGPGSYHTASNSPAKDGVNWWLAPGATVYGSRVIDDISGAKTFSISGAGIFQATNYYATVFLTNLNSLVSIHCKQIRHAGVVAAAGFEVGDAQVTCFAEDSIVSDLYDAVWNASGGWSGQGRVFVHASKIIGGNNGIELDGGQSYISADYVVGGAGGAAPTLNLLGGTNFVHIARIDCTNSTQANRLDGGKNVIVADRIVGGVVYVGGTSLINGATIGGSQLNQPPITSTAADDLTLQNCILDAAHASTTTSIQGHPTTDHTVKVAGSLSYTADKPPTAHVVLMSPWTQKYIGDGGGLTNLPSGSGTSGTGYVARVTDYLAQPFNVTNTVMAVISDSHGYVWPEIFTNLPAWHGLKAFTNATIGGTITASTNSSLTAASGTNVFYASVLPWLSNAAPAGTTVILWFGHGTVDQITTIGAEYPITTYITIYSNLFTDLRNRASTNGWRLVIARPSMVMQGTAGTNTTVGDSNFEPLWINNNWLARAPTNLVDFVPDFYRLLPDDNDLEFWDSIGGHPNTNRSKALQADLVDRTFRGQAPARPAPFTMERLGNRWEFRNTTDGTIAAKLYSSGNWSQVRGSFDGMFDGPTISGNSSGGIFTGHPNGGVALTLIGRTNQTVALLQLQAYNGASALDLYQNGDIVANSGKAIFFNHRVLSGGSIQFTNSANKKIDLVLGSNGQLEIQDTLNIYGAGPAYPLLYIQPTNSRVATLGTMSAYRGFIRSNSVAGSSLTVSSDILEMNGTPVTLPTAVAVRGKPYTLVNLSGANATIARTSSQTINGVAADFSMVPGESVSVVSDDTNWLVSAWYSPSVKAGQFNTVTPTNGISNASGSNYFGGNVTFNIAPVGDGNGLTNIGLAAGVSGVLGQTHGGAGTVAGILKADGGGLVSAATAETDYTTPTFVNNATNDLYIALSNIIRFATNSLVITSNQISYVNGSQVVGSMVLDGVTTPHLFTTQTNKILATDANGEITAANAPLSSLNTNNASGLTNLGSAGFSWNLKTALNNVTNYYMSFTGAVYQTIPLTNNCLITAATGVPGAAATVKFIAQGGNYQVWWPTNYTTISTNLCTLGTTNWSMTVTNGKVGFLSIAAFEGQYPSNFVVTPKIADYP